MVQLSGPYMTSGKTIALTRWTFVGKLMSLLFNMLSRLVIAFLPRSKHLLTAWLQSQSVVILEPKRIKSDTVSIVSPFICHEVMGLDAIILIFWMLRFKPAFLLSSFTFIKRLFSSSLLSAIRVVSSVYLRLLIFLLAILIPACGTKSQKSLFSISSWRAGLGHIGFAPIFLHGLLISCIVWWLSFLWELDSLSWASHPAFFSSVQSLSCVRLFVTLWTAARQASLSITKSWSLLKLVSIKLVMLSNHLTLYHPRLLPPSIFPSIRVFSNESVLCIRWPTYWTFRPSNEYSELISFKIDWFDVFCNTTVQKHNFFGAQLSLWSNSQVHTWLVEKP